MATVIDSFVLTFGIDPSGVKKGADVVDRSIKGSVDNARKGATDVEAYGKRWTDSFKSIRSEIVGVGLAFAGFSGLKDFIGSTISATANVGRLAGNIGMSVNSLYAWENAFKTVNGSAAEADATLKGIQGSIQDMRLTGNTANLGVFNALGITGRDLINAKDPSEILYRIADAAKRMPQQQFYSLASRLGLSDSAIVLLEKGRVGLEGLIAAQEKLAPLTDAQAKAAQEMQAKWANFTTEIQGRAIPAIMALGNALMDIHIDPSLDKLLNGDVGGGLAGLWEKVKENTYKDFKHWFPGYFEQDGKPADAGPPAPQSALGDMATSAGASLSDYARQVWHVEGGGQDNPRSTAAGSQYGRYQFKRGTFIGAYRHKFGGAPGMSDDQIWAKRSDTALQDTLMEQLTNENRQLLRRNNLPDTARNLYLLHGFGPDGINVIKGNRNAPLAAALHNPAQVLATNKQWEGMTIGQVQDSFERKMRGAATAQPARQSATRESRMASRRKWAEENMRMPHPAAAKATEAMRKARPAVTAHRPTTTKVHNDNSQTTNTGDIIINTDGDPKAVARELDKALHRQRARSRTVAAHNSGMSQ
jgi:hypothetical protein